MFNYNSENKLLSQIEGSSLLMVKIRPEETGEEKLKIGNVSVPDNCIKNDHRNMSAEHRSYASCFFYVFTCRTNRKHLVLTGG